MSSFPKKKVLTSEKVITGEEVDKGTKILDDMKEAVAKIRRKDLNKFEGKSNGSTCWYNIDHEFLKKSIFTLEPDFYNFFYEMDIEGQDMEPYKTFVVPFDNNKLNLL